MIFNENLINNISTIYKVFYYWNNDDDIKIITNKTYSYNRKVTLKRLFSQNNQDFSLGKISNRECILIKNEY